MARPSQLQGRLLAILDEKRNRRRLTRIALAAALLIVVAVVVPLSVLKAVDGISGKADAGAKRLQAAETATPGHVADAEGRGIANATIKRADSSWTATTDANGRFPLPKLRPGETAQLIVSAAGFLPRNYHVSVDRRENGEYTILGGWPIVLARQASLSGRVLGPDGKPFAGAPLSLDTHVSLPQGGITTTSYREAITDAQGAVRPGGDSARLACSLLSRGHSSVDPGKRRLWRLGPRADGWAATKWTCARSVAIDSHCRRTRLWARRKTDGWGNRLPGPISRVEERALAAVPPAQVQILKPRPMSKAATN